jgi:hypothetical protein
VATDLLDFSVAASKTASSDTVTSLCCGVQTTPRMFYSPERTTARIRPSAQTTLALVDLRGTTMGEILVLISFGAAFVTGLVIAGLSLFG